MKIYPSKLLLFGEYTVIKGSRALAVPYPRFSGSWRRSEEQPQAEEWEKLIAYLEGQLALSSVLDLPALRKAIAEGWYFDSNVPAGYGLGSSGALCAAILDRFGREHSLEPERAREILAEMEGFFHGKSSGLDPLVSFTAAPILVEGDRLEIIRRPMPAGLGKHYHLFLLDTGRPRETAPLVEKFLERCRDPDYEARCAGRLAGQTNRAISAFLKDQTDELEKGFRLISGFQWEDFRAMIPDDQHTAWQQGLEKNVYYLKLCGAGGGGFLLGFTRKWELAREQLPPKKLLQISAIG